MIAVPLRWVIAGLCLIAFAPSLAARLPRHAQDIPNPCAYRAITDAEGGFPELKSPDEVRSVNGVLEYTMRVAYSDHVIAGCPVTLRTYNGKLVGDTLRVKPGDTIKVTLINAIDPGKVGRKPRHHDGMGGMHGMMSAGDMDLDVTNLHTHGLHVSPKGISDNVFLEVHPGDKPQQYEIVIPKDHPAGTFWYHAHVHGSTAAQVSSGMGGTIIVDGGLDDIRGIKGIKEQVLLFQQISYNQSGVIEDFQESFGRNAWKNSMRRITVNGQLVPVIHMRPGEIQRWRLIEGGVHENISLFWQGGALNEVATDGLSLGRSVAWSRSVPLLLSPGYRSDVLVQAPRLRTPGKPETFYLMDGVLTATHSLEAEAAAAFAAKGASRMAINKALASEPVKPAATLVKVIVDGDPVTMAMPSAADLAGTVELKDIQPNELTGAPQETDFAIAKRICDANGHCPTPCDTSASDCAFRFLVNDYTFTRTTPARILELGKAAVWTVRSDAGAHPYHIHVNPFQVYRREPDGRMHKVWKDTILVDKDEGPTRLWMRYEDFDGDFVLHCHILDHEDQGMMQKVTIR